MAGLKFTLDPCEPFLEFGVGPANHFKKCFLDLVSDGALFAQANNTVIHFADRCDFGGGSGQKDLLRDI